MANSVHLVGWLGKDPELKKFEDSQVVNFSLATKEAWKNKKGEKQELTEWHQIEVWDQLAEVCQEHLKKGNRVYIRGRLKTRSYKTKGGDKAYHTSVLAKKIEFL